MTRDTRKLPPEAANMFLVDENALIAKLNGSEAIRSLAAEQQIARTLVALGWDTTHGKFYDDEATGKLRELDVYASMFRWGPKGEWSWRLNINLLVEVKTMRGFHLVFAPSTEDHVRIENNRAWVGDHYDELGAALSEAEVKPAVAQRILGRFHEFAADDGTIPSLSVGPPGARCVAGAVRETNIGVTKDEDNSVLWRAVSAVGNALVSLRTAVVDDNIVSIADYVMIDSNDATALRQRAGWVDLYHPIVVTDAQLWWLDGGSVAPLTMCRWWRGANAVPTWCDVVSSSDVSTYLETVTDHYKRETEKRGLEPSPSTA